MMDILARMLHEETYHNNKEVAKVNGEWSHANLLRTTAKQSQPHISSRQYNPGLHVLDAQKQHTYFHPVDVVLVLKRWTSEVRREEEDEAYCLVRDNTSIE